MKSPLTKSLLQTIENHRTPMEKLNNCKIKTNKKKAIPYVTAKK